MATRVESYLKRPDMVELFDLISQMVALKQGIARDEEKAATIKSYIADGPAALKKLAMSLQMDNDSFAAKQAQMVDMLTKLEQGSKP
jgi:hypothetical protein